MKEINNIYEALNYIDFDIGEYEKEELNDIEKRKLKKQFKKSIRKPYNFKKIASLVATLVLIIGLLSQTTFMKNAYAYVGYKLSEWSYSLGNILNLGSDIEPYSDKLNLLVESKGIEMKLTDVLIDEDDLILTTIVDTGGEFGLLSFYHRIFINGEEIKQFSSTSSTRAIDYNETIFSTIYHFNIEEIDLENEIDIRIEFYDASYSEYDESYDEGVIIKTVEGNWEFEFGTSGYNLMVDTVRVALDYSFQMEGISINLEELRFNLINQHIYGNIQADNYDSLGKLLNQMRSIIFYGQDNLGNEIVFSFDSSASLHDQSSFRYEYYKEEDNRLLEAEYIILAPYIIEDTQIIQDFRIGLDQIGQEITIYLKD